ncbi:MAG: hypothetical protein KDD33_12955 [Bdellovibrionales bacterium]|nr:hypothetical protein [Bdellovibrionales bacterium]
MSRVRGVKHFSDFFKEFSDDYVIIGGTAASEILGDNELDFRVTKDVDMVILTNSSSALNSKIIEYVKLGQYQLQERVEGKRYYRFSNPKETVFPQMLEIFARNESGLILEDGQHIIPIVNDDVDRLSAILLDDHYFNLIQKNVVKSKEGYSLIDPKVNICLKARAFRELTDRKNDGEEIDSRKIRKHRNDVLIIAQALTPSAPIQLPQIASSDLKGILDELDNLDEQTCSQILKGQPITEKQPLVDTITSSFIFNFEED